MTKKRTWEQNEQRVAAKKITPIKVCSKTGKPCEHKEKVTVTKEALEDGRITRNELLQLVSDLEWKLKLKDARIADLELRWQEQDNIINDMFDDLVEWSDKADWYRMWRNISIIINIILIILLVLCL